MFPIWRAPVGMPPAYTKWFDRRNKRCLHESIPAGLDLLTEHGPELGGPRPSPHWGRFLDEEFLAGWARVREGAGIIWIAKA